MGVMSRRVLPACSSLCYLCPSLRARSRQPVKRHKKIIADIYQLPPDGEPNDRRIGKLCDYVQRNQARIPKITEYLEQKFYKDLRHENFTLAKVVPCIYRKFLCSCKEQRPLLSASSLSIIRTLLDQKAHDDLRVMGCLMLVDFLNGQVDSTHMFNLEGLIPKLCQIGQELREDDKGLRLRSAALQALASMVQYMGDHSHISMELDEVGDVGPILDMIGVMLENLSHTSTISRTTVSSVYRTAQIAAAVYKSSYNQKAFPEALFHQLLLAMMHPDNKTRIGSHRVLSTIVAPSLLCPWSTMSFPIPAKGSSSQDLLQLVLSAFSSETIIEEVWAKDGIQESPGSPYLDAFHLTAFDENLKFMKLDNSQIVLLLSSIWSQAFLEDNAPVNFEAMGHTYIIALLCSIAKSSSHVSLVRCFQLAFSLRRKSLSQENDLQPSRRRCLYTMASAMLIFSAKVADVPQIIPLVKAAPSEKMVDPHLCIADEYRLICTSARSSNSEMAYGSGEDESEAQAFLSTINKDDTELIEIVISFCKKFKNLPEKFNWVEEQLHQEFSLDDSFPLGAPLFMETPHSCSIYAEKDDHCFDEDAVPSDLDDDDDFFEHSGSQSDRKTSGSMASSDVLTVNQLMESVHETARQVANVPVSVNPVPYDQMKSQCEALVMEKQQKMSVLLSFKHSRRDSHGSAGLDRLETNESSMGSEPDLQSTRKERMRRNDSASSDSDCSFRLPPASPYDKFLKAAGR